MKKIIVELLEQYEKDMDMPQFAIQYYTDEYIISKHYGFIKWLVDNDKVDKYNEDLCSLMSELSEFQQYEKCLLMLLAIQDSPIEYLISILR